MVHRRVVDGEVLVFGNHGSLFRYAMTWWDHDTGSIWSQPLGEALAGPRKGQTLELIPSEFTSWGSWRAQHPNTLVLDAPGDPTGFDLKDFFVVVDFGAEAVGYPISDLRVVGVANDEVAGVPIAVVSDPGDPDRWAVFARSIGALVGGVGDESSAVLEFEISDGLLVDLASGATFDPTTGRGLNAPYEDLLLPRLPALTSFPGGGPTKVPIFDAFWPDGRVWRPPGS